MSKLKDIFDYNKETGKVFRKDILKECKCISKRGYIIVSHQNKRKYLHRIIWEMVNGAIPNDMVIDHINRDRTDNRLTNLRCIPKRHNNQNMSLRKDNTSGHKGVMWNKATNSWRVRVKTKHVGLYSSLVEAIEARKQAEREYLPFA